MICKESQFVRNLGHSAAQIAPSNAPQLRSSSRFISCRTSSAAEADISHTHIERRDLAFLRGLMLFRRFRNRTECWFGFHGVRNVCDM